MPFAWYALAFLLVALHGCSTRTGVFITDSARSRARNATGERPIEADHNTLSVLNTSIG